MLLDETQLELIKQEIREEVQAPRIATVTAVNTRESDSDGPGHLLDAELVGRPQTLRDVPVLSPVDGSARLPRAPSDPGGPDDILVQYLAGENSRPVVTHVAPTLESPPPKATNGDIRMTRGDLYVEMAGDGSSARLARKPDDRAEPDLVVEVDADGTIRLGDPSGSLQPVARKGDSVEVSDPESGTLTGSITGGSNTVESS
jgi:hypothetical protein